jgi:hypothetical protein
MNLRTGLFMSAMSGYLGGAAAALLSLAALTPCASAQGTKGPNVIMLLQLAGDGEARAEVGSCLAARLSSMPDVEIAAGPTDGVRFIVDIVAAKDLVASLVVAETFPAEQYRMRIKEGEDRDALIAGISSYTLLRLHELVPGRSRQALCASIAAEIGDKVLSKEYTERND